MLNSRSFWDSRHFPLLMPDGEGGGSGGEGGSGAAGGTGAAGGSGATGGTGPAGGSGDPDAELNLGDRGKAAIKAVREERDAIKTRAEEAETRLAALEQEKSEREAAEAKAKEEEAAKKGEFEQLAEKRGKDLEAAKADVTRLTSENDQYKAAMADGLEARLKELPDKLRKLLEDAVPEDDTLGRWQWLHKPTFQELVKDATAGADPKRGNGVDPKSRGDGKVPDEAKRASQARVYQRF